MTMGSVLLAGIVGEGDPALTVSIPWSWLLTILGTALGGILIALGRKLWPTLRAHFQAVSRLKRAERALDRSGKGLWLTDSIEIEPPENYARKIQISKPIVVVANLKGGVGKTTTVANLIGHYGQKKNKRILAIDADFQGSLSATVLSQANYDFSLQEQVDGSPCKAAQLVEGRDAAWVRDTSVEVEGVPTARCIPSYYTLSSAENRVMVQWLVGARKDDIRYSLAKTLHDPMIQDRFDLILIDAPPRLTTGCVQALCAATHVLIPTILDGLSAEATGGFIGQLVTNQRLWPHLKLLGISGTMTDELTADLAGC
jgi:chromosome partitioning protein